MLKRRNRFTTASARVLFNYDFKDRARNNGAKLSVKHVNTSVARHFYPIKITTTWNAIRNIVVTSRAVNSAVHRQQWQLLCIVSRGYCRVSLAVAFAAYCQPWLLPCILKTSTQMLGRCVKNNFDILMRTVETCY